MLAHRSVLSPSGLSAMADAGLGIAANIEQYSDEIGYVSAVRRRVETGETAAFCYPNPSGILSDVSALVDIDLHRALNNKGMFSNHFDPSLMPKRRLLDCHSRQSIGTLSVPVVIKAATDETSSGGKDVLVCENVRHLKRAARRFAQVPSLIAEDYVKAKENWAAQCAVLPDGSVEVEGATEQITSRSGIYSGNFFETAHRVPEGVLAVSKAAASAGSKLGYRGLCGFDILVDEGGKAYLIDPNFRPTWSTPFLFQCQRQLLERGGLCARFVHCTMPRSLDAFLSCCRPGFDSGWLLPLATFDPRFGHAGGEDARILVMILGQDRQHIEDRELKLRRMGAEFTSLREAKLNSGIPRVLNTISRRIWRKSKPYRSS